jgi:hypothetical protein
MRYEIEKMIDRIDILTFQAEGWWFSLAARKAKKNVHKADVSREGTVPNQEGTCGR